MFAYLDLVARFWACSRLSAGAPNAVLLSNQRQMGRGTVLARLIAGRSGFTMLEVLVVVVILGLVATMAAADLSDLTGRYRLNGAARELAKTVESCRVQAISNNREYALVLVESDPSPDNGNSKENRGRYEIRVETSTSAGIGWETVTDGVFDFHEGPNEWRGVSIEPWAALSGASGSSPPDSIVFSPRGYVLNNPADFTGGVIRVVLRNKEASFVERRVVRVHRGGIAQIAAGE